MLDQRIRETRGYYEEYPFIEGGPQRIAWWQDYMKPFLPDEAIQGRLIADIGSSVGEISRGLANRGARMTCLDLTSAALQRCKQINPEAELYHGSALNLPFADGTFDHAISIGVLMVTPDCRKGIREVARITAPGGTVVLFIYNYWCYLNFAYQLFAPVRKVVPLASVPSFMVRMMQPFVKSHLGETLDEPLLRRLLGDKLWTPHATFHTLREIKKWGAEEGLTMFAWKRFYHAYANVMAFKKAGNASSEPKETAALRCLKCGESPISKLPDSARCRNCDATYLKMDGVYEFLPQ